VVRSHMGLLMFVLTSPKIENLGVFIFIEFEKHLKRNISVNFRKVV
jgi:hypothetical protein